MLQEEAPTNAEEANELIGAFLLDIGIAKDETEVLVSGTNPLQLANASLVLLHPLGI